MKQEIIERLDELKEQNKWIALSLRPPEGHTIINEDGNRLYINEGRDGYFEGIEEKFYDYCVQHYDSREQRKDEPKLEEYRFFVDRKATVWIRETHFVEAYSKGEAIGIAVELFKKDKEMQDTFIEQETVLDTIEMMQVGDNEGKATVELIDYDTMDTIADNVNY